jgi:hypothetical protein
MIAITNDPYDNDPQVTAFVDEVVWEAFGENYRVERNTNQADDYFEGIDLYIINPKKVKLPTQLKTRYEKRSEQYDLSVHLNYATEAKHPSGFDLYHKKKQYDKKSILSFIRN